MKHERDLVPAVCRRCGHPMRIWGGYYMAERNPDGSAPVARMWGGDYTHAKNEKGECLR